MNTFEYRKQLDEEVIDFLKDHSDDIRQSLVDGGNFDEYSGWMDSDFHSAFVDRAYSLKEAVDVLENCRNVETDSGLWQGQDAEAALSTQAAFSYGNDARREIADYLESIKESYGELKESKDSLISDLDERISEAEDQISEIEDSDGRGDELDELKSKLALFNRAKEFIEDDDDIDELLASQTVSEFIDKHSVSEVDALSEKLKLVSEWIEYREAVNNSDYDVKADVGVGNFGLLALFGYFSDLDKKLLVDYPEYARKTLDGVRDAKRVLEEEIRALSERSAAAGGNDLIQNIKSGKAYEVLESLINGSNPNAAISDDMPPLSHAIKRGSEMARLLVIFGADVNAPSASGRSPLMAACSHGYRGLVDELIQNGANLGAVDSEGKTALIVAAQSGHSGVVDLLLNAGADASVKDKDGKRAIDYAGYGISENTKMRLSASTMKSGTGKKIKKGAIDNGVGL